MRLMAKVRMAVLMISLIVIFLSTFTLVASGKEITYCVTPTENSTCLDQNCQQCKTLGYYNQQVQQCHYGILERISQNLPIIDSNYIFKCNNDWGG